MSVGFKLAGLGILHQRVRVFGQLGGCMNASDSKKTTKAEERAEDAREPIEASAAEHQSAGDRGLLAEILEGVYRAEGQTAQGFAAIRSRLELIEQRLGIAGETLAAEESGEVPVSEPSSPPEQDDMMPPREVLAEVVPERAATGEAAGGAEQGLPPMAQSVAPVPQPTQPVQDVRPVATAQSGAPTGGELEAILFGQDLAADASLSAKRQDFLLAMRRGHENAIGLAGQILTIRAATMDRLPTLLKDVGEAWYRWRGDDGGAPDALRDALIAWLHARLDAVGLGNRIELVRAGDRYDSKRHNAKARGVEVTGVQGWVVLRDNGNVYTKANVTVA